MSFEGQFHTTFTQSLVQHGGASLQVLPTAAQRKTRLRNVYRRCRDKENEALKKATPLAILKEDESLKSYGRNDWLSTLIHHLANVYEQNPIHQTSKQ